MKIVKASKQNIKGSDDEDYGIYDIEIGFAGMVGVSNIYNVEASSLDEAIDNAKDAASDDLVVEDIVDEGDGEYTVTISFDGYTGSEVEYQVYEEDEDSAEEAALEEAYQDLTVVD